MKMESVGRAGLAVGDSTAATVGGPYPQQLEPKVSIIIVSYNHRDNLGSCLSSILEQCYRNYEVLVVDNGSHDGSADYVEGKFPGVQVIRCERNWGFGAANNLGASQASGDILVFLNPDTIVTPRSLKSLQATVAAGSQPCLVSPKILFADYSPPTIYTCGNHVSYSGLTFCRGWGQRVDKFIDSETIPAISGTCFAVKREVFESLGGFDDLFFLYLEDTDLSWRGKLAGLECKLASESVIYHQYGLRFTPQKSYYLERNRYVLLIKNLAASTFVAMLPLLLFAEVIVWGYLVLKGPQYMWHKVRSYGWLVRHWRQIMESREQAQALRQVSDRDVLSSFSPRLLFAETAPAPVASLLEKLTGPIFDLLGQLPALIVDNGISRKY